MSIGMSAYVYVHTDIQCTTPSFLVSPTDEYMVNSAVEIFSIQQGAAVCCSVLQCAAVCCSVLQCVAVCCSVLQCVAVCCKCGLSTQPK